jgi:hypothetical protein
MNHNVIVRRGLSGAVVIRSDLFDLQKGAIGDKEISAIWAFIASGLATGATIVGLLLTRSYNDRALERTTLDTVVKGLELLVNGDGTYAKKAKIAGSLAALVHLGHPTIAMRTLSVAWDEGAVDAATACWLISEVFKEGSEQSQLEASKLLYQHADDLTTNEPGRFDWPPVIATDWPQSLSIDVRGFNLFALFRLLLSRPKSWWGFETNDLILVLEEARCNDKFEYIRDMSATALRPIVEAYPDQNVAWMWKGKIKDLAVIRKEVTASKPSSEMTQQALVYIDSIKSWAQGVDTRASLAPSHPPPLS